VIKRVPRLLCAPLLALGVAGCASTTSSSNFKGEQHAVAQVVSNLQSEATAGEAKKICKNLLSSAVTTRLNAAQGGCTQAVKSQLTEVDTPEATVESVQVTGTQATAHVKSIYAGKDRLGTLALVKEGGKWKISGLG
jgi:hypothetical protein